MVKVALHEGKWYELPKNDERGMYIDGYLKTNLDMAKTVVKKDWDMIFVYDGYEGSGKSVKAMQDAYYCDPTLNIDRIVFNPDDFVKACTTAKPYQAVIFDEAYGGLNSRSAMGTVNKSLVQMLTVIRQKNLFIFIVLPSFFDLDKYVALWRSRALVHVYVGDNFKRGFFEFYNSDRKKNLYVKGKKFYDYGCEKANFRGAFTAGYPIDEEAYRKKKAETSIQPDDKRVDQRHIIAKEIKTAIAKNLIGEKIGLKRTQVAQILGCTRITIYNYLKAAKKDEEIDEEAVNELLLKS